MIETQVSKGIISTYFDKLQRNLIALCCITECAFILLYVPRSSSMND